MKSKLAKAALALVILLVGYVGSYIPMRLTRMDKSERTGRPVVVFPNSTLASIYRPLSAIDRAITGTRSSVAAPEPSGDAP